MSKEVPVVTCSSEETGSFFGDGLSYYLVKNVETGLCLDDYTMQDKWNFDALKGKMMRMYLRRCDSKKKQYSQYFRFDEKNGTLGKVQMIKIFIQF